MTNNENILKETNTVSKEEKLDLLNQMVEFWRRGFDKPPRKSLRFTVDASDVLCLDGIEICDIADADADSAYSDINVFFFRSLRRGYYCITIDWNFKGKLSVQEIALVLHQN